MLGFTEADWKRKKRKEVERKQEKDSETERSVSKIGSCIIYSHTERKKLVKENVKKERQKKKITKKREVQKEKQKLLKGKRIRQDVSSLMARVRSHRCRNDN